MAALKANAWFSEVNWGLLLTNEEPSPLLRRVVNPEGFTSSAL